MGVHFLSQYRNPLAYPAGYKPGFTPNHVASKNLVMSSVSVGNTHVNLLNGVRAVLTGTPDANIDGISGPGTYCKNTTGTCINFSGFSTAALDRGAYAFIFKLKAAIGSYAYLCSYGASPGLNMYLEPATIRLVNGFGSGASSGLTAVVDEPYFMIATYERGLATDFYLKNLRTGKLLTVYTATDLGAATPSTGNIFLGASSFDTTVNSPYCIQAAACIRDYIPRHRAHQWCDDPWSFWYPNPGDNWFGVTAAAGGGLFKITGNPRSLAGFGGGLAA